MKRMFHRTATTLAIGAAALSTARVDAAAPEARKIVAIADSTQGFGSTKRAVSFYDVTNLNGGSVFGQQPLFSVWTGYEYTSGAPGSPNLEEIESITFNPINGTMYIASFDSVASGASVGDVDHVGDTQGDYDLYRVDYQELLKDYQSNNRPMGTMYVPTVGPDGSLNVAHPDHPFAPPPGVAPSISISNAIQKIGEVARPIGPSTSPFYSPKLEFANPANLVLLGDQTGENAVNDDVAHDHEIRILSRTSTTPGGATYNAATAEGGFNGNTIESWKSTIAAKLDMDNGSGRSEPVDMAFVRRDGVQGVWVGEADGGGDDVSFFELNFNTLTATNKEFKSGPSPYTTSFALDNDPVANPSENLGQLDWIAVDKDGNLRIGESGNFDAPQTEPKVIGRVVTNYNNPDSDANGLNEVAFGPWSTSNYLSPTLDDDSSITDGRFVTIDKGTGHVYFFDIDSAGANAAVDVYVFDPVSGTMVYEELNAVNHFTTVHGISLFVRGDVTGDGVVNAADIDAMFHAVLDPTLGGTVTSAIGQEWLDLNGDNLLLGVGGDVDELVNSILGTAYGDSNLDGQVNFADFQSLQNNFGGTGKGWADGDFNGDGSVSFADFQMLQNNFGFVAQMGGGGGIAAVPEPSSVVLLIIGGVGVLTGGRLRRVRGSRNVVTS